MGRVKVIRRYLPVSYSFLAYLAQNWQYNILPPSEFRVFCDGVSKHFAEILKKSSSDMDDKKIFREALVSVEKFVTAFDDAITRFSHRNTSGISPKEINRWKYRNLIAHLVLSRFFAEYHGNNFFVNKMFLEFTQKTSQITEGYQDFLTESVNTARKDVIINYVM